MERNILLCAKQGCRRCAMTDRYVPMDCEFRILHLFPPTEFVPLGETRMPRRSGKTYRSMQVANYLAEYGEKVLYIVDKMSMIGYIRQNFTDVHKGIVFVSCRQIKNFAIRGYHNVYFVLDDVTDKDVRDMKIELDAVGKIFSWMWTPLV